MVAEPTTRERLLRVVWNEIRGLTPQNVRNYTAAARAIDAGAAPSDIASAMMAAQYEIAFRLLFLLSCENAEEGNYEATLGWSLEEVALDLHGGRTPTGTDSLLCVHEDLLTSDPLGVEGRDIIT